MKIAIFSPDSWRAGEKLGMVKSIGRVVGADVKVAGCYGGESGGWKACGACKAGWMSGRGCCLSLPAMDVMHLFCDQVPT